VKVNYRGYDVWEIPPNTHGIVALMALNILDGLELGDRDSAKAYHQQIEAIKLAFADGLKYIADIRKMKVKVSDLLSEAYAAERRSLIGECYHAQPRTLRCAARLSPTPMRGNMVSYIKSN